MRQSLMVRRGEEKILKSLGQTQFVELGEWNAVSTLVVKLRPRCAAEIPEQCR